MLDPNRIATPIPVKPKVNTPNIHQRILGVMADVDYIAKGEKTVNGQYRFVGHDAVTAKLHPYLVKHRLTAIPTTESVTQEGNRTVAKVTTQFTNVDDPNDWISATYFGYGVDSGDKGPGKAVSYAFKYALLKTFNLETGDDPDNDASAVYEPPKCVEFDALIAEKMDPRMSMTKVNAFLKEISATTGAHVEDVKREALKRIDAFMESLKAWNK